MIVHLVDERADLVDNVGAVELHGSSEVEVLRSPLLRQEANGSNSFDRLELEVAANGLEVEKNEALDLRMSAEGGKVLVNVGRNGGGLLGEVKDGVTVGDDGSNTVVVLRIDVDDDALDIGRVAENRLELFKGNVLTMGRLDEVLLTINDGESSVGIRDTNITSREPTVVEGLGGLLRLLVVTLRNGSTAQPDLTTGIRLIGASVVHIGDIDELDLHGGEGRTKASSVHILRPLDSTRAASLSKTITLHDRDTEADAKEIVDIRGERSGSRNDETQTTTNTILELVEDNLVPQGSVRTDADGVQLGLVSSLEEELRNGASLRDASQDTLLQALEDGGDSKQDSGTKLSNITEAVANTSDGKGTRRTKTDRGSSGQEDILADEGENMGKRQETEVPIILIDDENLLHTSERRDEIAMVDHHSLRVTSRSRSVHDASEIVESRGLMGDGRSLTSLLNRLKRNGLNTVLLERGNVLSISLSDVDDSLERLDVLGDLSESAQEGGTSNHEADLSLVQGEDQSILSKISVDSEDDIRMAVASTGSDGPLEASLLENGNRLSAIDAQTSESGGKVIHALSSLLVGNPLEMSQLRISHRLLNTIDNLREQYGHVQDRGVHRKGQAEPGRDFEPQKKNIGARQGKSQRTSRNAENHDSRGGVARRQDERPNQRPQ